MTENKDKHGDKEKDKKPDVETDNGHEKDKEQHDRNKGLSQLLEVHSVAGKATVPGVRGSPNRRTPSPQATLGEELRGGGGSFYHTASVSFQSELLLLDMDTGENSDLNERLSHKDEFGTQRVYKKTSPNCVLTLYLPSREIMLAGTTPSILRGIVFVDPKAIQGYRVYAQLTLTFRYGREDEEVMGLRFCNEAIMSLHQVWPRNEEPARESLSPLQDALLKRLGDGAHPFTLSLTPQAPPSVQLVPAKRYFGAPIGTSYDVRCFIADKTDEKFHRRASVKMGVRVIYRTDVFSHSNGPENFAALINNQAASPPPVNTTQQQQLNTPPPVMALPNAPVEAVPTTATTTAASKDNSATPCTTVAESADNRLANAPTAVKPRKSERGDSFPKLRLSPKSFRFSGRFGRSKSEIEKCPNDPFYNYSKSFQEYDNISCSGGPQGAVDKPFLLQDGRVGLRASLDKAWYTHGEDVCVTVNIRNDSRKTVRKVRVCAIQHVDVCMFNNGKFKNVVADSDIHSPGDRTVPPGGNLNTSIVLKPQRGPTKNWIALEDTLQRSTEPDEITGVIAASAIRSPNWVLPTTGQSALNPCPSPAVGIPHPQSHYLAHGIGPSNIGDDRNVFAIYVSYYVKVKLTLSGMGGELSLKLPFVLVHVDESQRAATALSELKIEKLALDDVPANRKNGTKSKLSSASTSSKVETPLDSKATPCGLDRIESVDDEVNIRVPSPATSVNGVNKRRLLRSETIAKDLDEEAEDQVQAEMEVPDKMAHLNSKEKHDSIMTSSVELEHVHVVQIHNQVEERSQEVEAKKETVSEQEPV